MEQWSKCCRRFETVLEAGHNDVYVGKLDGVCIG